MSLVCRGKKTPPTHSHTENSEEGKNNNNKKQESQGHSQGRDRTFCIVQVKCNLPSLSHSRFKLNRDEAGDTREI